MLVGTTWADVPGADCGVRFDNCVSLELGVVE